MPLNQRGSVLTGSDLQVLLVPSAAYPAATYHVGTVAVAGNAQALGLKSGASALPDMLYAAGPYLQLVIDVTTPNGGTLTVTIQGFDVASGKFYTILASAAITTAVTTILRVGPALTAAANLVANDFMPLTWQVSAVVATATMTFSIGANYQL